MKLKDVIEDFAIKLAIVLVVMIICFGCKKVISEAVAHNHVTIVELSELR